MSEVHLDKLLSIADAALEREAQWRDVPTSDLCKHLDNIFHQNAVLKIELNLPDALGVLCALCRDLSKQGQADCPHRLQIAAAAGLYEGSVVEMANGEGKTLAGALAAALRAKSGMQVHVSTFNNYLVRRDATWMWPIYQSLGLRVACLEAGADSGFLANGPEIKDLTVISEKEAYAAPILYAEKTRLGLDFLQDNLVGCPMERRQGPLDFVLIDEVDSTLIDQARQSLQVTASPRSLDPSAVERKYRRAWEVAQSLAREQHYLVNEKARQVDLTDAGRDLCQSRLGADLYRDPETLWAKLVTLCLKGRELYLRGREYQVIDGQVVLIDSETGRLKWGQHYSGGLHQALQLKEGLGFTPGTAPLAEMTIQNYYKQYRVMSGMSGSVWSERDEIEKVYRTPVVRIPTRAPIIRKDSTTRVYRTRRERNRAAAEEVAEIFPQGRPILVGVEDERIAEEIAGELQPAGITAQVLTASNHELEAEKIAAAGKPKIVTITAKLAGRGTDIKLESDAVAVGGLHVIIVGLLDVRHESQLRGRAGRRGLPGSSSCLVSLEDELMAALGEQWLSKLMLRLGMDEGVPIESHLISQRIDAVREIARRSDLYARMSLYGADSVLDRYRTFTYKHRASILDGTTDPDQLLNTFAQNVVVRQWSQAGGTRSFRSRTDEATASVTQNLVRLLMGTTIESFTDVGRARGERARVSAIAARVKDIVRVRKETARQWVATLSQFKRPSAHDLVVRAIARDAIDQAWAQFLQTYDYIVDSASVRGIAAAERAAWLAEQSGNHFQKTLADVEVTALSWWMWVSHEVETFRRVLLDELKRYGRWDDAVEVLAQWAEQAPDQSAQLYSGAARIAEIELGDSPRAQELYDDALDSALASGNRNSAWSIAAEILELKVRRGDMAGFRSTSERLIKGDPAFSAMSLLIQELGQVSADRKDPPETADGPDHVRPEPASPFENVLPRTESLCNLAGRMLKETMIVLGKTKHPLRAARLLRGFGDPLRYWAGAYVMASCVLDAFADWEPIIDLKREIISQNGMSVDEVLSRFDSLALEPQPATGNGPS